MKKKKPMAFAIATLVAVGGIMCGQVVHKPTLTKLQRENIEALASGEVTVVGCKPYKGATCYVFDGSGQLVDRRKNQYPGD